MIQKEFLKFAHLKFVLKSGESACIRAFTQMKL